MVRPGLWPRSEGRLLARTRGRGVALNLISASGPGETAALAGRDRRRHIGLWRKIEVNVGKSFAEVIPSVVPTKVYGLSAAFRDPTWSRIPDEAQCECVSAERREHVRTNESVCEDSGYLPQSTALESRTTVKGPTPGDPEESQGCER